VITLQKFFINQQKDANHRLMETPCATLDREAIF